MRSLGRSQHRRRGCRLHDGAAIADEPVVHQVRDACLVQRTCDLGNSKRRASHVRLLADLSDQAALELAVGRAHAR